MRYERNDVCNCWILNLGECLFYIAIQNLFYVCKNIHLATAGNIKSPPMHHAFQMYKEIAEEFFY